MMGLDYVGAAPVVVRERGGKAAQAIVIFATTLVLDADVRHVSYFPCGRTRRSVRPLTLSSAATRDRVEQVASQSSCPKLKDDATLDGG
jgi:hypothetical protein